MRLLILMAGAIFLSTLLPAQAQTKETKEPKVRRMGGPVILPDIQPRLPLERLPTLSQPFFGVSLGEPIATLQARCDKAGLSATNHPSSLPKGAGNLSVPDFEALRIRGSASGNDTVEQSVVTAYRGRVSRVAVTFKDGSSEHRAVILKALNAKYVAKAPAPDRSGASSGSNANPGPPQFATQVDGRLVTILVNFPTVTYIYDAIDEMATAAVEKAKTSTVVDVNKDL